MQRVDSQEYGECDDYEDKQQVFADQRDDERRWRINVGQQEEKHRQGEQDGNREGDLLAAVWGEVEHENREARDGDARHDEIQRVEQGPSSQGHVEHYVWVRFGTTRVIFHSASRSDVYDVPLYVGVEVSQIYASIYDKNIVGHLNSFLTDVLEVKLRAVVGPRTKFEETLLHVKGKELDVNLTVTFIDGRRLPDDPAVVVHRGLRL